MEHKESIAILQRCCSLLEDMTQEDFDRIMKEKELDEKDYDSAKYIDYTITIIL